MKHTFVAAALTAALATPGCMFVETPDETIDGVYEEFEAIADDIRLYQIDVLFPALAVATEAERNEYRWILDSQDDTCGAEPEKRREQRRWMDCGAEVDRRAAAVLGVEPFGAYLVRHSKERKKRRPALRGAGPARHPL